MAVRRKVQETPVVRRGRKANDPADYAEKAPEQYHKDFAKWLVEVTGYNPTSRKDFLKAVQFACDLRNGALGFNSVGTEEEEPAPKPVVRKRGAASQATKATAGKTRRAAPVEEPEEEEEWEETEDLEEDEEEFEGDDEPEDEDESDEDDEDDDDWEDEEEEEEAPAPVKRPAKKAPAKAAPAKTRASSSTAARSNARTGAAKKAAPAKKAATGTRRPKPSDEEFTF
jgi:hypothetical protein